MSLDLNRVIAALPHEWIVLDAAGHILETYNTHLFTPGEYIYDQISPTDHEQLAQALQNTFDQSTSHSCEVTRKGAPEQHCRFDIHLIDNETEDQILFVAELKHHTTAFPRLADTYGRITYDRKRDIVLHIDELSRSLLRLSQDHQQRWYDLEAVHPDDRKSVETYHKRIVRHADNVSLPSHLQFRIQIDTDLYWLDAIIHTGATADIVDIEIGRVQGIPSVINQNSTVFAETLIDALPGFVLVYDFDQNRTIYTSPSVEQFLGMSIFGLPDSTLFSRVHPDDLDRMIAYGYNTLPRLQDGKIATIEIRIADADGNWRWCLSRDAVLTRRADGSVKQIIGIIIDITEQKETEAELRHAWRRFQSVFENTTDAIFISNWGNRYTDATLIDVNAQGTELMGYSKEEIMTLSPVQPLPEDEIPAAIARREAITRGESQSELVERRALRKDGSEFTIESLSVLVRDDDGKPIEMIVFARDITERKRQQKALEAALEAAEAAAQSKSAFLANMGHELRTPLNAIIGYAEILKAESTSAEQQTWSERIIRNSRHLLYIINDILTAARLDINAEIPILNTPFDLTTIVNDIMLILQPVAAQKQIRLCVDIQLGEGLTLEGDVVKIRQIITNLLHNAVKFTDSGAVCLKARIYEDHELELTIVDTGPGMTEEQLNSVFTRFFHPDPSKPGAGLGLAITHEYVEILGGTIAIRSELGVGTEFTLRIPVTIREAVSLPTYQQANTETGMPYIAIDTYPMPDLSLFEHISQTWLRQLHTSAKIADNTQTKQLIEEIQETHPQLAQHLYQIIDLFLLVPLSRHIAPILSHDDA